MIKWVLGILSVMTVWFSFVYFKDVLKHKDNLEDNSWGKAAAIGFTANFFDTLGIGSFAILTSFFKATGQTHDRIIPGTLNVSCTIPIVVEAFAFMSSVQVEPITLFSMLASATIGAYFGAGIVSHFSEKKVQLSMGTALFVTAFLMFAGQVGIMPGGGEALGLSGAKLAIAITGNFVLGVLMTAGIGLYAPCMALVYFLGMSPAAAFPIMMGSCAFLMPAASVKFIKESAYDRRTSISITAAGVFGVLIAAYIVKSLPLDILRWLVIAVVLYTSVTMLRSAIPKTLSADKEAAL